MRYLLDICIYAINERPPAVLAALRRHHAAGLVISSVTAAELHFGVTRTGSQRNREALRRFLDALEISAFDAAAAEVCGAMRAWPLRKARRSVLATCRSRRTPWPWA